jgi:hypothetical protein
MEENQQPTAEVVQPPRQHKRIDFHCPRGSRESKCTACGAEVAWILSTKNNRWQPLSIASTVVQDGERYMESHFADCPKASRFRKKKKKQ